MAGTPPPFIAAKMKGKAKKAVAGPPMPPGAPAAPGEPAMGPDGKPLPPPSKGVAGAVARKMAKTKKGAKPPFPMK